MSLLEKTKFLLRKYRISPNRTFGQNFIIEPSIFESMTNYASLEQDDVALDIGAGLGFSTGFLANQCKEVLAVEADNRLVRLLLEQFKDSPKVKIVAGNVLKTQIPQFDKTVSTPPYQISSHLLPWLLKRRFDCSVLIFQKEFANRLIAPVGSEEYGWLTVLTYYHAECELLNEVPKHMFYPRPNVDSIVVRLTLRNSAPFDVRDESLFIRLLQFMFARRNRRVRNAIYPFLRKELTDTAQNAKTIACKVPCHDERVRSLAPEDFGALADALFN
jgi:16S rRNA (adenine1518-N6/adenine1519-N6)-dimethyltransferase